MRVWYLAYAFEVPSGLHNLPTKIQRRSAIHHRCLLSMTSGSINRQHNLQKMTNLCLVRQNNKKTNVFHSLLSNEV
jgi:hypothetical protein